VLLACLFGSTIGHLIFGLGGALWVLFLSRLIAGIAGGTQSTASAYIIDVSPPEERLRKLALIGMAWGLGLIVGPVLGTLFGQLSLEAPPLVAAALSFGALLLGLMWLPESLPPERRAAVPLGVGALNPFASIGEMAHKPGLGTLLLVLCLFNLAFQGISSVSSLFVIDTFAARQTQVGLLLLLVGFSIAAVQAFVIGARVTHWDARMLAIVSLLGQAVSALAICLVPALWPIYALTAISSALSGLMSPALNALTANHVDPHELGALMGVTTALSSAMSVLGSLWAGAMYDHVMPGAPYWMGAGVFVLAALALGRGRLDRGAPGLAGS
jgi:DHA1 family tetracycline resistance protein-like MFS transporter